MKRKACIFLLCAVLAAGLLSGCQTGQNSPASSTSAEQELKDGTYAVAVTLGGGSGRASIENPTTVTVKDGTFVADITWSSNNYDYMMIGDTRYEPVSTDPVSVFQIPVEVFDEPMAVSADTTAMSTPHLIDYTLTFNYQSLFNDGIAVQVPEEAEEAASAPAEKKEFEPASASLTSAGMMELTYAEKFTVEYFEEGCSLITIADTDRFLLLPEGAEAPDDLASDIKVLQQPLTDIYLAASSAMDLFRQLGALDQVSMTSTDEWSIPEVPDRLADGSLTYVGKYSAPDYETVLSRGASMAIESNMIYHSPKVKEQLETLGLPVLVEYSSYESHPLGRTEWIKLYGLLTGRLEEAETFFADSLARVEAITLPEDSGKSVAFFYISSTGYANVRKPGDYISKMIEMAGGTYALNSVADDDTISGSTMNMQMEAFYAEAREADVLIYNGTIEGPLDELSQLLEKWPLLADFKSVKEGNVWCTEKNMYQQTTGTADLIVDMNRIITGEVGEEDQLTFLHRLK